MKIAIIGSRDLQIEDFFPYLPSDVTELISGGAKGIDTCVKQYAQKKYIKYTEFRPNARYKKGATFKRNDEIIAYADIVLAFWNQESKGTEYVIKECAKKNIVCIVYRF